MAQPTTFTAETARFALTQAIKARLETLTGLSVFIGEIPSDADLAKLAKGGGRIAPYAVIHPSAGRPDVTPGFEANRVTDALWSGQIDFTTGYDLDLLDLLDQAVPLLHLWRATVPGVDCGPIRPPVGYEPGPFRRNTAARPTRVWTPLLWQIHHATA